MVHTRSIEISHVCGMCVCVCVCVCVHMDMYLCYVMLCCVMYVCYVCIYVMLCMYMFPWGLVYLDGVIESDCKCVEEGGVAIELLVGTTTISICMLPPKGLFKHRVVHRRQERRVRLARWAASIINRDDWEKKHWISVISLDAMLFNTHKYV